MSYSKRVSAEGVGRGVALVLDITGWKNLEAGTSSRPSNVGLIMLLLESLYLLGPALKWHTRDWVSPGSCNAELLYSVATG